MRKLILLFTVSLFLSNSFASAIIEPSKVDASKIFIPIGKTGKKISLLELSKISQTDLEILTGKKMNFLDKIAFKKTQKKLNKNINEKGIITDKKINKFFRDYAEGKTTGFHGLGFVLGFFLNWVGIILAYVINDDADKKNRVKWAWIGFGISVVLWIIIYAALIAVSV